MTELQLYKFISANEIELHWNGDELTCFVNSYSIGEFCELLGYKFLADRGIECMLKHNCIAFDLCSVCDYFDIEPENICNKEEV